MSIYLPTDLAERLRGVESSTASGVVQEALRRHFGNPGMVSGPVWAQPPSDADMLLFKASTALREEAVAEYQAGFRAAVARLPDVNLAALTSFARDRFDLEAWLRAWRGPQASAWVWALAKDVGSIADGVSLDEFSFRRTVAYEHGYSAALRAAYEAVERGEASFPQDDFRVDSAGQHDKSRSTE